MSDSRSSRGVGIFPSPSLLLKHPDPDGVIAVSPGHGPEAEALFQPQIILEAYAQGIFPWPLDTAEGKLTAWFCPPRRAILDFDRLHLPESLRRQIKKKPYQFRFNQDFEGVIRACATISRKGQRGESWITPEMVRAYCKLFELGKAWCVEALNSSGRVVGGIYGVRSQKYFSAESMFHTETGASKLSLLELIRILKEQGDTFLDIQMLTPHLERLGAREISRRDFFTRLGLLKKSSPLT